MSNGQEPLWPFGMRGAFLPALGIWIAMTLIFVATRTYLGWPDADSIKLEA